MMNTIWRTTQLWTCDFIVEKPQIQSANEFYYCKWFNGKFFKHKNNSVRLRLLTQLTKYLAVSAGRILLRLNGMQYIKHSSSSKIRHLSSRHWYKTVVNLCFKRNRPQHTTNNLLSLRLCKLVTGAVRESQKDKMLYWCLADKYLCK